MELNRTIARVILTSCLLAAVPAMGAGNYAAMSRLPPMMSQGGVTYLSGGIGQGEVAAIQREDPNFPLTLEFVQHATPRAQYLANVNVTIRDQRGTTVLNTVAEGPFLLARLPDGKYTVSAENNGQRKERDVVVAEGKKEHVILQW